MWKTVALLSMYTIPNYTLFYAPMCCCAFATCNNNCVSISCMEYVGVSYSVAGSVLVGLCDSSYVLCEAIMSVYGVGSFL
jgi:hypothetical protein